MNKKALRNYITGILLDVKGDNEYPSDEIVFANASLIMHKLELINKERIEAARKLKGKYYANEEQESAYNEGIEAVLSLEEDKDK